MHALDGVGLDERRVRPEEGVAVAGGVDEVDAGNDKELALCIALK